MRTSIDSTRSEELCGEQSGALRFYNGAEMPPMSSPQDKIAGADHRIEQLKLQARALRGV